MKKQFFIKEKTAVAGAIEFLLLIGLFAIVLSLIQLTYIPEIMAQKESEHMKEISNQFSQLKAMMDIQSKEKTNIPISTIITLGSNDIPYFVTVPAQGEISIIDNEDTEYEIIINDDVSYNLTAIRYNANNNYFVAQSYILESGGVIINQPNGNPVMWTDPPLNATAIRNAYGTVTSITMYFDITEIISNDLKDISGYGQCYILTNYSDDLSDDDWKYLADISNINITTVYPNAWYNFINRSFEKDVKNNISFFQKPGYVRIEKKGIMEINLYYRKTSIYARIEPGG